MNKNKLKNLSVCDRRDLYLHYYRLLNNFYVKKSISERHYQQIRTRCKRLKSVMSKEEIISIIRRLRYLGYLYNE